MLLKKSLLTIILQLAGCETKNILLPYSDTGFRSVSNFFLSEHFAENRMTVWCTIAKLWCCKLCATFSGTPYTILIAINTYHIWTFVLGLCL